jgi:large subunit ribosomal protein L25
MEKISVKKRIPGLRKREEKEILDQGYVRGVLYGKDLPSVSIYVKIKGKHNIHIGKVFSLQMDKKNFQVSTNQIQRDPVRHNIIHIGFLNVAKGQRMIAEIPLVITGKVNNKGVMQSLKSTVLISGKPEDIPEEIQVDVEHLKINDKILLNEIKLKKELSWEESNLDQVVVRCNPPQLEIVEEKPEEEIFTDYEKKEESGPEEIKKVG